MGAAAAEPRIRSFCKGLRLAVPFAPSDSPVPGIHRSTLNAGFSLITFPSMLEIITLTKQSLLLVLAAGRMLGHDYEPAGQPHFHGRNRSPRMAGGSGLAEWAGLPALRRDQRACDQA